MIAFYTPAQSERAKPGSVSENTMAVWSVMELTVAHFHLTHHTCKTFSSLVETVCQSLNTFTACLHTCGLLSEESCISVNSNGLFFVSNLG